MKKLCSLLLPFMLISCKSPEIKDTVLNDRVKACGAGFSESMQANLQASLDKAAKKGGFDTEIKEETKTTIFEQMPDSEKVKAYEDYIACIEKNWNANDKK